MQPTAGRSCLSFYHCPSVVDRTMPPRLNKRQLRELEELQALETTPVAEIPVEESSDEQPSPPPKKMTGGFAAVSKSVFSSRPNC